MMALVSSITTDWKNFLNTEIKKDYFQKLSSFLNQAYLKQQIFPSYDRIFYAFTFFNLASLKVVIIGQDPYPSEHADGLAFSSPLSTTPSSLKNIKQEIFLEYGKQVTTNDLSFLAQQGVLLINTNLTVQKNLPLSHSNIGWEEFIVSTLNLISTLQQPIVFLLWGQKSINLQKYILTSKYDRKILTSAHPSPLSCHKGFFNNNHFKLANQFLKEHNINEIRWWNV